MAIASPRGRQPPQALSSRWVAIAAAIGLLFGGQVWLVGRGVGAASVARNAHKGS